MGIQSSNLACIKNQLVSKSNHYGVYAIDLNSTIFIIKKIMLACMGCDSTENPMIMVSLVFFLKIIIIMVSFVVFQKL